MLTSTENVNSKERMYDEKRAQLMVGGGGISTFRHAEEKNHLKNQNTVNGETSTGKGKWYIGTDDHCSLVSQLYKHLNIS